MFSVLQSVKRLTDRFMLSEEVSVDISYLLQKFQPTPNNSLGALLTLMNQIADAAPFSGGGIRPYFRRRMPAPQDASKYNSDWAPSDGGWAPIDLSNAYQNNPDRFAEAVDGFDARAAAVIAASANPRYIVEQHAGAGTLSGDWGNNKVDALYYALLERQPYDGFPAFYTLRSPSLAMMAYNDFFPSDNTTLSSSIPTYARPIVALGHAGERIGDYLRDLVNVAIMQASPGFCGTNGPTVTGAPSLGSSEGNYDMTQTHLVALAYSYYDELTSDAREHLIRQLVSGGIVHRPNEKDFVTGGPLPGDWERAGYVSPLGAHKDIGETENHIISNLSSRYLVNQLLYQRDHNPNFDNRRNARAGPSCMDLVLSQLRNILRDDFSEYNAKSYQEETRWPLLNLATYAYDHEVRLAARMVLDYISAHIAVSSNDLRRIVPFRRRNEGKNVTQENGVMAIGMVDAQLGADPLVSYFAIQTGNLRAYEPTLRIPSGGQDETKEVLSAYRLPPLLHDLFVNDLHRRFFQRLHRTPQDETEGARNCDNFELYASSPSYLISAGGQPATFAIDPYDVQIEWGKNAQQIGVAMPTTFMPTGQSAGPGTQYSAKHLIQFSHFSDNFRYGDHLVPEYLNYGVAPDFACGYGLYLPRWATDKLEPHTAAPEPGFHFINCRSDGTTAGFYLAIYREGDYALMEAFDTWLHKDVTFEMFRQRTLSQNPSLDLNLPDYPDRPDDPRPVPADQIGTYVTYYGTRIRFDIWRDHTTFARPDSKAGAYTDSIVYSDVHPTDGQGDAGNLVGPFLNGTILNSPREAVVEITNPFYGPPGTIVLDMNDPVHPRRVSENGDVEQAGLNNEVWVNFGWTGPYEGDFFHPFNTMKDAVEAVADGGVIKIVPGWTVERPTLTNKKRCTIKAVPGVGVRIGIR